MFRTLFTTLQAPPHIPASDVLAYTLECVGVCDLLIDTLREEALIPHPALHALMTLMWRLLGNKTIPMLLEPFLYYQGESA